MGRRMRRSIAKLLALLVSLSGCVGFPPGLLYTDRIQPLCKDMRSTGLGLAQSSGSSKRVTLPTTRIDISAEWDSRAIGDIGKKAGMKTVYGCDVRRESYLLGLWRRDEVIVYGE
jgi:hypothetical protein